MVDYRLIDHTADLGLHVTGTGPADLFAKAGLALFDVLTDVGLLEGSATQVVQVQGDGWPDLMVNWLRELLYLWSGEEKLVHSIVVQNIKATELTAHVSFDAYIAERHLIKNEVKAVTYHQIQVRPVGTRWEARIIFDV
jgi:SHS2 domain-containing protein